MSEKNPLDLLKELLSDDNDVEDTTENYQDNNPYYNGNNNQNNFNNSNKNNFNNSSTNSNNRNDNLGNALNSLMGGQGFDKMRQVMDMMQGMQGDSRTTFLNSLRPHLSNKRQGKLDKAMEFLAISQAFQVMRNTGKKGD